MELMGNVVLVEGRRRLNATVCEQNQAVCWWNRTLGLGLYSYKVYKVVFGSNRIVFVFGTTEQSRENSRTNKLGSRMRMVT